MSYAKNPIIKAIRAFFQQRNSIGKGNVKFIGEDLQGNKYFEETKPYGPRKIHRYFLNPNIDEKTQVVDLAKVPPLWDAWLRYRRQEPPSAEEMKESEEYFKFQQDLAAKRRAEQGLDPTLDPTANPMGQLKRPERKLNSRPDIKTMKVDT